MLRLQKEAPGLQRQKTMDPSMLSQVYIYFSMKNTSLCSFMPIVLVQASKHILVYILTTTNPIAVYNFYFVRTRHLEHQCRITVTVRAPLVYFIP